MYKRTCTHARHVRRPAHTQTTTPHNTAQCFKADFALVATTENAKDLITKPDEDYEGREDVTDKNWEPRIKILNKLEETKWRLTAKVIPDDNGGKEIRYKYSIGGTFLEEFELENFPVLSSVHVAFSLRAPS